MLAAQSLFSWVCIAAWECPFAAPLGSTIFVIVANRADEKMIWTHASSVITAMQNTEANWDCPDRQLPRRAMCLCVVTKYSVAV